MIDGVRWWRPGEECHYCAEFLTSDTGSADHVWPKSLGGTGVSWNLVPACRPCNSVLGHTLVKCWCPFCASARDSQLRQLGWVLEFPAKRKRAAVGLALVRAATDPDRVMVRLEVRAANRPPAPADWPDL